jgi:hypothetical protein
MRLTIEFNEQMLNRIVPRLLYGLSCLVIPVVPRCKTDGADFDIEGNSPVLDIEVDPANT